MKPLISLLALSLLAPLRAAEPSLSPSLPLADEARATMAKATAFMRSISNEGDYLDAVKP